MRTLARLDRPWPKRLVEDIFGEGVVITEKTVIEKAIGSLSPREVQVIELGKAGYTLKAAGIALGISRDRVRQIEAKALRRLRLRLRHLQ